MGIKLTNNAISRLSANILATDLTISVIPGDGAAFPSLSTGDWFPATIISETGAYEIVRVTSRTGDVMTIERAQETTIARGFTAGDRFEHRLTAAAFLAVQADVSAVDTRLTTTEATLNASIDTVDERITTEVATLNASILALFPTGFGPLPWSRATPPDGWIFADGRVLLAATPYTALRAAYIADSYPYGSDGAGNPRIPDMCGRVAAGRDTIGAGRLTSAWGVNGTLLGASGGSQSHTLTASQMPSHVHGVNESNHTHAVSDPGHTHTATSGYIMGSSTGSGVPLLQSTTGGTLVDYSIGLTSRTTGITLGGARTNITLDAAGSGSAHHNVQPTLVTNYILKV